MLKHLNKKTTLRRLITVLGGLTLFILASGTQLSQAATAARALDEGVSAAINTEAAAQNRIDSWNRERDQLLEEARTMKYESQWLELQYLKLSRYVAANDAKISGMEEAQGRYAVIALELENSLLEELERMEASIAQSPPFLAEERSTRLRFLRQSLDDPELSIGEKYRRFTEGLNAEVEYGRSLEVSSGKGSLGGDDIDLILVRAGRVGYYCLTLDRSRGGVWNPGTGNFTPLEGEALQAILNLEMMYQTKQYYNFAALPVLQEAR